MTFIQTFGKFLCLALKCLFWTFWSDSQKKVKSVDKRGRERDLNCFLFGKIGGKIDDSTTIEGFSGNSS